MLAPEEPKLITPKLLWKGRSLIYGVQDLIALERWESRDAEVGCADCRRSFLHSPEPPPLLVVPRPPLRAVDTRGAETLRVWAAGVENILRERHARVGPGADVDPPHYSKLSGF